MQGLIPESPPNGTIGPLSPLQSIQLKAQQYQPVRRLLSVVDFINQNILGPPENALGNFGLGAAQAGVVPFIKKKGGSALDNIISALNQELEKVGYLGFDNAAQARQAIRGDPAWAFQWDVLNDPLVKEYGDKYRQLVESQKTLEKLGLAPEKYTAPTWQELMRERISGCGPGGCAPPKPAPPKPAPPDPSRSNVIPFKPKGPSK